MQEFERLESEVRSYCRSFPVVFKQAVGCRMIDEQGRAYLDFFAGAGTLNYGHNNPRFKRRLLEYLQGDGIAHALDLYTAAKRQFLLRFNSVVLQPRAMEYKLQFPSPSGCNAVEAALKVARKVTGRQNIVYFANSFHGMSLGALSVTSNQLNRAGAGIPLAHTMPMPFDGDLGSASDSLDHLEAHLKSAGELPAGVIVETIQAEGGVRAARFKWLQRLEKLTKNYGIPLIVDDIQAGCGRTGPFFSFEEAGIRPDLITLSKSLSGFGLPMSLLLIRPEFDLWKPGEHNGTFRGNNLAFVTAAEALSYWEDDSLCRSVQEKGQLVRRRLEQIADAFPEAKPQPRGRGLLQGIAFAQEDLAGKVARESFRQGLIIETCGPQGEVLKFLPPLVIEDEELQEGLDIVESALKAVTEGSAAAV